MIMGSEDFAFLKDSMNYSEKFKFIHFQVLQRCGHVCNIERSEEFNKQSL